MYLADPTERQPPLSLSRHHLELLLATRAAPDAELAADLRCRLGLGHRGLSAALGALRGDIARFGLLVDAEWDAVATRDDHPLPLSSERTLEPFAQPDYRLDGLLQTFSAALDRHGYTEDGIIAALGVDSLQQIEPTHLHWHAHYQLPQTPLADLIRLLQLRADCPRARVESHLGAKLVAGLLALGVLHSHGSHIQAGALKKR